MPRALRNSSIARAGGSRILSLRERTNHCLTTGRPTTSSVTNSAFLKFGSHRMRENDRNSYPYNDRLLDVHVEARRMAGVPFFDVQDMNYKFSPEARETLVRLHHAAQDPAAVFQRPLDPQRA